MVVIGGLNMDLHMFGIRPPAHDGPLVAEHHFLEPGGKGANLARAAARLGARVSLVGRVGDDEFGRLCLDSVDADGVDSSHVRSTPGEPTGFVAIELRQGKHHSIVFSSGANARLTWDDVAPALTELSPHDMIVSPAELPVPVLEAIAREASDRGIPFFLDPTPPGRVSRDVLGAATVITPDRGEGEDLSGRSGTSHLAPLLAVQDMLAAGCGRVTLKLGEEGVIWGEPGRIERVPTLGVEARDETGAGDVFMAGLAVRRLEGAEWSDAIRFANAASAISVANTGLYLPTRDEVEKAVVGIPSEVESLPH